MAVSLIGSQRKTSEEARLDKNRRIKESIKATKAKRKTQTCSTFDLKIVGNKLSSTQREALTRVFLEAKWLWNECIASGDPFSYKPRKKRPRENQEWHDERTRVPDAWLADKAVFGQNHLFQHQDARHPQKARAQGRQCWIHRRSQVSWASATGDHLSHTWTKGENPEYSRLGSCAWRQTIGKLGISEGRSHQRSGRLASACHMLHGQGGVSQAA